MKKHVKTPLKAVNFHGMLSSSPKMHKFFEVLKRVARTNSAVLIRGESGTGKELAARAIHNLSPRKSAKFNAVNCAMLTPDLAISELFGHVKGSFTGAVTDHVGFFEDCHKGSLFLDEIAELPLNAQSQLLRAIQEKMISKLGSTRSKSVDVRIISATHKALRVESKRGNFREDLMYRLRVVPLYLPRLVERGQDLELLLWGFIEEFNSYSDRTITSIDDRAWQALMSYEWPGNIRELKNNIENAFAVGEGECLLLEDLTPELRGEKPIGDFDDTEELQYREQERRKIISALNKCEGNKGEAADLLQMSRSTLWRKMKTLGIS